LRTCLYSLFPKPWPRTLPPADQFARADRHNKRIDAVIGLRAPDHILDTGNAKHLTRQRQPAIGNLIGRDGCAAFARGLSRVNLLEHGCIPFIAGIAALAGAQLCLAIRRGVAERGAPNPDFASAKSVV